MCLLPPRFLNWSVYCSYSVSLNTIRSGLSRSTDQSGSEVKRTLVWWYIWVNCWERAFGWGWMCFANSMCLFGVWAHNKIEHTSNQLKNRILLCSVWDRGDQDNGGCCHLVFGESCLDASIPMWGTLERSREARGTNTVSSPGWKVKKGSKATPQRPLNSSINTSRQAESSS